MPNGHGGPPERVFGGFCKCCWKQRFLHVLVVFGVAVMSSRDWYSSWHWRGAGCSCSERCSGRSRADNWWYSEWNGWYEDQRRWQASRSLQQELQEARVRDQATLAEAHRIWRREAASHCKEGGEFSKLWHFGGEPASWHFSAEADEAAGGSQGSLASKAARRCKIDRPRWKSGTSAMKIVKPIVVKSGFRSPTPRPSRKPSSSSWQSPAKAPRSSKRRAAVLRARSPTPRWRQQKARPSVSLRKMAGL